MYSSHVDDRPDLRIHPGGGGGGKPKYDDFRLQKRFTSKRWGMLIRSNRVIWGFPYADSAVNALGIKEKRVLNETDNASKIHLHFDRQI